MDVSLSDAEVMVRETARKLAAHLSCKSVAESTGSTPPEHGKRYKKQGSSDYVFRRKSGAVMGQPSNCRSWWKRRAQRGPGAVPGPGLSGRVARRGSRIARASRTSCIGELAAPWDLLLT